MLAGTDTLAKPTAQTPAQGPEQAPAHAPRVHLEGDADAGHALTLCFQDLVESLLSFPDPDPQAGERYDPGLDLLHALREESTDFGRAAPAVAADAPLAEQILGITDEAFDRAGAVLDAVGDDTPTRHRENTPELYLLMARLGTLSVEEELRRIRRLPPVADRRLDETGGEFY